jgi:NitT/TauT family transport system ATP-binding protein
MAVDAHSEVAVDTSVTRGRGSGPIIEATSLAKTFEAGGRASVIFRDFSLSVDEGEFLSIVGPSGCGKSTLLRIIAGLEVPDSGSLRIRGQEVSGPHQDVIYVFQQYVKSIFPWKTVLENVKFGVANRGLRDKSKLDAESRKYIRMVGLDGYEDFYPKHLSGGMQQRVAIARALICEPKVLLMDEPFSAVDALTRATLQQLLLELRQMIPVTILFVTHDAEEATFLSSRVISLAKAPATIADDVRIDLPYPRHQVATKEDPMFLAYRHRLFERIFAAEVGGGLA